MSARRHAPESSTDPAPTPAGPDPDATSAGADDHHAEPARPDEPSIGVTGTQVAASVLASVSAAVVASLFGVAGTIVGAAVVSVVATVGGAAYSLGIRRTRDRLQQLQALQQLASLRPGRPLRTGDTAVASRSTGTSPTAGADDTTVAAGTDDTAVLTGAAPVAGSAGGAAWRDRLTRRRWGVAAGVAIVFVLSLSVVTLIELIGDRPLSGQGDSASRTSLGALLGAGEDVGNGVDTDDHEGDDPGSPDTSLPSEVPPTSAPEADGEGGSPATTAPEGGDGTPTTTASPSTTTTTSTTSTTESPPTTGPAEATDTVPPTDPAAQPAPAG